MLTSPRKPTTARNQFRVNIGAFDGPFTQKGGTDEALEILRGADRVGAAPGRERYPRSGTSADSSESARRRSMRGRRSTANAGLSGTRFPPSANGVATTRSSVYAANVGGAAGALSRELLPPEGGPGSPASARLQEWVRRLGLNRRPRNGSASTARLLVVAFASRRRLGLLLFLLLRHSTFAFKDFQILV